MYRASKNALAISLLVDALALGEGVRHPYIDRERVEFLALVEEDTIYDNRDEILSAEEIEFEGRGKQAILFDGVRSEYRQ